MRFTARFRNGYWSAFDLHAYRPGIPCRYQAEAIEQAEDANRRTTVTRSARR